MDQAPARDWMRLRRDPESGVELLRAGFTGHAYDTHSHDCYLIGHTDHGVQSFRCRGGWRHSPAGGVVLIEPEEPHDGEAVCDGGFAYSMLYAPVALVRAARQDGIGAGDLGFCANLADDARLARRVRQAVAAFEEPRGRLARDAALLEVVRALDASRAWREPTPAPALARRAREVLHARFDEDIGLEELAALAGSDRFRLSRGFQAAYGAPPHRYLVQLRLNHARRRLAGGEPPAAVAAEVGFADQSHMGRWFRRAFGCSPAAYARACTDVPDAAVRGGDEKACSTPRSRSSSAATSPSGRS